MIQIIQEVHTFLQQWSAARQDTLEELKWH